MIEKSFPSLREALNSLPKSEVIDICIAIQAVTMEIDDDLEGARMMLVATAASLSHIFQALRSEDPEMREAALDELRASGDEMIHNILTVAGEQAVDDYYLDFDNVILLSAFGIFPGEDTPEEQS